MAEFVFDNCFFSIGGVDLSDHVRSLTLGYSSELQDKTAMGNNTREMIGGLKDWSVEIEWNQDFAAAKVDATLWAMVGESQALIMRPDAGTIGATNPEYTGNGIVESYAPIGGAVGDLATAPTSIRPAGDLARAIS